MSRRFYAALAVIIAIGIFLMPLIVREIKSGDALADALMGESLGGLPVLKGGRVMPISSAGRDFARMIGGRETAKVDGSTLTGASLLWRLCSRPDSLSDAKIFRTDNRDLQRLLGVSGRYFSFSEISKNEAELMEGARSKGNEKFAEACRNALTAAYTYSLYSESLAFSFSKSMSAERSVTIWREAVLNAEKELERSTEGSDKLDDKKIATAARMLKALNAEMNSEKSFHNSVLRNIPDGENFSSPIETMLERKPSKNREDALVLYSKLRDRLSAGDTQNARQILSSLYNLLSLNPNIDFARLKTEQLSNAISPFFGGFLLYGAALLCFGISFSFVRISSIACTFAGVFLSGGVFVHIIGIAARMYIQMRPPVTNMYSSVVFAGACAALLGLIMNKRRHMKIYGVAAAASGFLSLLVALNLPSEGDTMGVMRAVLNSNFWLTAHVVTIMVGYCGVFLGGTVSAFRLIANPFSRGNFGAYTSQTAKGVYSMECFALLFVFAGTMLGGIWADMSWGRFWGWDPKENGALLTLLWCTVCIHGKVFKIFSDRAFLSMCVFGNVVAAWGWFGVNLLGVGLHSYGFVEGGWKWFFIFMISQLLIMPLCFYKYRETPIKGLTAIKKA